MSVTRLSPNGDAWLISTMRAHGLDPIQEIERSARLAREYSAEQGRSSRAAARVHRENVRRIAEGLVAVRKFCTAKA